MHRAGTDRRKSVSIALAASALALSATAPFAAAQSGTVKIAWIDPLSGMMAPLGENQLHSWQYAADYVNKLKLAGPDVKFEIVPFDGKLSPQESVTALKSAIDQGIRYVVQGNGSGVGLALEDAVTKYNERNPGKEVVYLNYAAVDPAMTNEKCSFWHFRLDINSNMKMEALTTFLAANKNVKKVYLINQNYSFGQAVQKGAEEYLKKKRPDIEIVGTDLHPLAQVRDFSPYVAKIKASGADTIITGNWGADLALLVKAAKDAGLNANFYTYYAGTTGVPTAMGAAGADRVNIVANWQPNDPKMKGQDIVEGFKKKYDDDFYTMQTVEGMELLADAIKRTKSIEPIKVAYAMEGAKIDAPNGEIEMRASDHQLQQPVIIATWKKVNGKTVKFDQEKTGYGWESQAYLEPYVASQPTSCQMKRPPKP